MTATTEDIKLLFAEFPRSDVSWRAQHITKDGSSALALAYIDARDVMDRLDQVCGAANWQDRYEVHGGRVVCYLSVRVEGEWVTKADGAGDTAVEAEKGGISDAFKRAAVKWGIGRYLYAIEAPWVPCECKEFQSKKRWSKWTADPWAYVKGAPKASSAAMKRGLEEIEKDLLDCRSSPAVIALANDWKSRMSKEIWTADFTSIASQKFKAKLADLKATEQQEAA